MTERASETKTFIIAEEQHVNIDYIYNVTSFFRQERREVIVLSMYFRVAFIKHSAKKEKSRKNETAGKKLS